MRVGRKTHGERRPAQRTIERWKIGSLEGTLPEEDQRGGKEQRPDARFPRAPELLRWGRQSRGSSTSRGLWRRRFHLLPRKTHRGEGLKFRAERFFLHRRGRAEKHARKLSCKCSFREREYSLLSVGRHHGRERLLLRSRIVQVDLDFVATKLAENLSHRNLGSKQQEAKQQKYLQKYLN